jgi:hypothetical protein
VSSKPFNMPMCIWCGQQQVDLEGELCFECESIIKAWDYTPSNPKLQQLSKIKRSTSR